MKIFTADYGNNVTRLKCLTLGEIILASVKLHLELYHLYTYVTRLSVLNVFKCVMVLINLNVKYWKYQYFNTNNNNNKCNSRVKYKDELSK